MNRIKKQRPDFSSYKEVREGKKSALDALEMDDEEDIFEEVDEDTYKEYVKSRKNAGDFVVDDNGLGYYDNGEETYGGEKLEKFKRKLDPDEFDAREEKASKKVKGLTQIAQKNTIKSHLQNGSNLKSRPTVSNNSKSQILDINSLVNETLANEKKSSHKSIGSYSISSLSSASNLFSIPSRPLRPSYDNNFPKSSVRLSYNDNDNDSHRRDYGSENNFEQDSHNIDIEPSDLFDVPSSPLAPSAIPSIQIKEEPTKIDQDSNDNSDNDSDDDSDDEYNRRAKALLEEKKAKEEAARAAAAAKASLATASAQKISYVKTEAEVLKPISFDSEEIYDSNAVKFESYSSFYDESLYIHNISKLNLAYQTATDFFCIDFSENNGILYLFGKVPIKSQNKISFVSTCIHVNNTEKEYYFLPKDIDLDNEEDYLNLKNEVLSHVKNALGGNFNEDKVIIEKKLMSYAFEISDVPRSQINYLRIVLPTTVSSSYGSTNVVQYFSNTLCDEGGKYFRRIFNNNSTILENFILSHKLMGPSWLKVFDLERVGNSVSWCKIEANASNPSQIYNLREGNQIINQTTEKDELQNYIKLVSIAENQSNLIDNLPSPPLTSLSFSIKTVVNPSTRKSEIVSIAGYIHTNIDADGETKQEPSFIHKFTLIRPLGNSSGPNFPPIYPHDLAKTCQLPLSNFEKTANNVPITNFLGLNPKIANESQLIENFYNMIKEYDPDVLASHNLYGFTFSLLLERSAYNKIPSWSILGRLKRSKFPKVINDSTVLPGRVCIDTYKSAKEFVKETNYSLTSLSESLLGQLRIDIEPLEVPKYYRDSRSILQLCRHTSDQSWLTHSLLMKLQIIPLTKQLTNISGNIWSRTARGLRAERIEYLLLHNFYQRNYILPVKKTFDEKKAKKDEDNNDDDDDDNGIKGSGRKRGKAKYSGGYVLEPKKGLYDTFVVLLDFNSLYPSIIQEYNLCFTTIDWTKFINKEVKNEIKNEDEEGDIKEVNEEDNLPPIPTRVDNELAILPFVISGLVEKRKQIKSLIKSEKNPDKLKNLDIRQKAVKLTANSMYGCLGFSSSRFYAPSIAALVTFLGRRALKSTVKVVTDTLSYDVIYGDTDSIMIDSKSDKINDAKKIGEEVKSIINKSYKCLEIDLDGIFKSMLLLKKKKYAALVYDENGNHKPEMKGLDLVRRDWCSLSKDAGEHIVRTILSGKSRDDIKSAIVAKLEEISKILKNEPIEKFVITKGLNKNPNEYPDSHIQPHVQVALKMVQNSKHVGVGDHIPYVICEQSNTLGIGAENLSVSQKAFHPDEFIQRSKTESPLTLDYTWYLKNQILPPISRLCDPISEIDEFFIAEKLGLVIEAAPRNYFNFNDDEDNSYKADLETFEKCEKDHPFKLHCLDCKKPSVFYDYLKINDSSNYSIKCPECNTDYEKYNEETLKNFFSNRVNLFLRQKIKQYYSYQYGCTQSSCNKTYCSLSRSNIICCDKICQNSSMTEDYLYTLLRSVQANFDLDSICERRKFRNIKKADKKSNIVITFDNLFKYCKDLIQKKYIDNNSYGIIDPSIWKNINITK